MGDILPLRGRRVNGQTICTIGLALIAAKKWSNMRGLFPGLSRDCEMKCCDWKIVIVLAGAFAPCPAGDEPFAPPPIQVPEGYSVELAAGPPLVRHPIMAGFDDRGRLFVAETAGLNLKREELEEQLPGFITMLEDSDGDGKFDKSTLFADKLTFPQGALWHAGALYVASSGGVWRLRDTDDDGVADQRDLLLGGFGYTGNAADVHGCFLHPNGRIYFVQGRHGHEVHDPSGKLISRSKAGGIFSIRPDGSDFRRHATGGFDNPVELIFTEEGEALGTVNIFEHPPRQDCLVHWVEGGLYPRTDFVRQWDEFISTGDLLPPAVSFGHVAVSGLCRSRFDGDVFVTLFNTHEVRRVKLMREGSTFTATHQPFLSSPHPDFHPTDVLEDADGSLLVIDTGGWFRIGCPTSQIAKPDVLGAIYRIRRTDAEPLRPAGATAIDELWASIRAGNAEAVWDALHARDHSLRQIAAHGAGLLAAPRFVDRLSTMVIHDEASVRRESATALGLIGRSEAIPALLASLRQPGDLFISHAIIHALISIGDGPAIAAGLADRHPAVRRGAVIALDRMGTGHLKVDQVIAALETEDPELRRAATEILTRHGEWAVHARQLLADWLARPDLDPQEIALTRGVAAAFAAQPAIVDLLAQALGSPNTAQSVRMMLLDVLDEHGPAQSTEKLAQALGRVLDSGDPELLIRAARVTGAFADARWDARLSQIAADSGFGASLRVAALQSLAERGARPDAAAMELLLAELAPSQPLLHRRAAAQVIATVPLEKSQLEQVMVAIRAAGPIELPLLMRAFERAEPPPAGGPLFEALAQAPGLQSLDLTRLESLALKLEAGDEAAALLSRLRREAETHQSHLDQLEGTLTTGDATNGRTIFFAKGTCFVCHRVGEEGGTIGPDLSTIGAIRTQRDLLEAIAFPNASFARGYEPMSVTLKNGGTLFGRIARETQNDVSLVDPQGIEHTVKRDQIEKLSTSTVSLMPAGLERLLTTQELSDLLEYLRSLR